MQIYYINLATQPKRRAALETRLAALGLAAERIEAVTPADLTEADKRGSCDPKRYFWLTEPELACNFSHIAAMRRIAGGVEPFGLILEDDVLLSSRLPAFLDAFERAVPPVDVLKLDNIPAPLRMDMRRAPVVDGVAIRRVLALHFGTGAYIISRASAERLAASPALRQIQVDTVVYNPFRAPARQMVVRHADPALATHVEYLDPGQSSSSTLAGARKQHDAVETELLRVHPWRRFRRWAERDIVYGVPKTWAQLTAGAVKRVIPYMSE